MIVRKFEQLDMDTSPHAGCEVWRAPACPFVVETSSAILNQLSREALAGLHAPRGGHEIGGVLFGIAEPDSIRILASRPLNCEHAMGPGFVLSEKDERLLAELISSPVADPEMTMLHAVGWYHSHIRSQIFLSERDMQTHSRYFAGPYQIALVIHPRSSGPTRAGFFFREPSGEIRTEASYQEFSIETPSPTESEVPQAVFPKQTPSHARRLRPAKPEPSREFICPKCHGKHLRRSRTTGPIEQFCGFFGFHPYRCQDCLSRSFLKTSSAFSDVSRPTRKRPEERRRARQRTRREMLLWGGGVFGFLAILYFLIRDSGPKADAP